MIGQKISHYEILEKLGQGGMGVVYKAHDTKLDRDVALKFLPPHLAASEQDKARFIQEAKAAAALNHPNVCSVIDISEYDSPQGDRSQGDRSQRDKQMFIVMEFVDGKTLREAIPSLSMKQAMDVSIQIADGLAAAHEKGIVHRDIKPENIMVRKDGIVQIMDFGLAKLRSGNSKVTRLTKEGSTVGTAGYMSPEQVQGFDSDHRSDIFSFGVVMYEMLTGQMPFRGVHETALLYEIVNVDPAPMTAVKPELDPSLDAIVLECLEKDPKERTQSASQIAVDLKRYKRESSRARASRVTAARPALTSSRIAPADAKPEKPKNRMLSWAFAALSLLVVFAGGYFVATLRTPRQAEVPVLRTTIEVPKNLRYVDELGGHSGISPDGTKLAFLAADSSGNQYLWVRNLRTGEMIQLTGAGKGQYPCWSPDSRNIAFFSEGKLKTIDCAGGPSVALADAPFGRGIAWSGNGTILFQPSVSDSNFWSVPAGGGAVKIATQFDTSLHMVPRFPSFLPDGVHFVFSGLVSADKLERADAFAGSLNDRTVTPLLKDVMNVSFSGGYLLYLRQGILMAQRFDPGTLALGDKPVAIQGNINSWNARAKADFSTSNNGLLLFGVGGEAKIDELFWVNTAGAETSIVSLAIYRTCQLSPDGTRIAYDFHEPQSGDSQVWLYDIDKRVKSRISISSQASTPRWSADGKRLFYHAEVGTSKATIMSRLADGSGEEDVIAAGAPGGKEEYNVEDVSPDGKWLLMRIGPELQNELALLDLADSRRPIPPKRLGIPGTEARFSPDGRWIAYTVGTGASKRLSVAALEEKSSSWELAGDVSGSLIWTRDMIFYYSTAASRFQAIPCTLTGTRPVFSDIRPLLADGKAHNDFIHGVTGNPPRYLAQRLANAGSVKNFSLVVNWQGLASAAESAR